MKKLFTIFLVFMRVSGYSQLYVPSGETIFTTSNGELTSKENVTNNGTIYSVEMNKTTAQTLSGTGSLRYLNVNNSADISLSSSQYVTNNGITLTAGKIIIGNYNVTTASISNDAPDRFIKTNGTGLLRMNAATGGYTKYPIGNSSLNYIRVYNNNATADTFSVRVQDTLYANAGSSSGSINNAVNRTWYITKTAANTGSGVNLEFNWNAGDINGTLSNATLYEYNGAQWVKSSGSQSVSGNQLTISGYTGALSAKQFMVSSALGATVSVTSGVCQNATGVNVTFTGSNGTAPYTFTYTLNGGSNQTVSTTSGNSVTVAVNTSTAGSFVYALVSVEDGTVQNTVSGSDTISINATSASTTNVTRCSNQLPYAWNGTNYSAAGTYTYTTTNAAGCDSVVTLNLIVNNTSTSTTNVTLCSNQLPYAWNGTNYSAAGTYTYTTTNAAGCDSVATLNLTVNNTSTSTTNVTRCSNQLPYAWNGTNYSSAGTYTYTTTNAAGCDSVATLNLTVNSTSTSTTNVTRCSNQLPYAWNGTNYSAAGIYTYTTNNAAGCDSVATLNLTISNATSSTTTQTATGSYSWNGTTYTSSGTYIWTGTNAAGCDSVATLILTITTECSPTSSTQTQTACGSYTWNGNNYTTSGTYTWTGTNAAGCDSVVTLNLTIFNSGSLPTPEPIQGLKNVCLYIGTASFVTYTVPVIPGAAQYNWTFGGTSSNTLMQLVDASGNPITYNYASGYNTPSNVVRLKFLPGFINQLNKQIRVRVSVPCGVGPQRIFYVSAERPGTPSAIVPSTSNICPSIGTSVPITYTIPSVPSTSDYVWSLTTNGMPSTTAFISHPNGTGVNDTTVSVTFANNFSSGVLTVLTLNNCGLSLGSRSYSLIRIPATPGLISGPVNACEHIGEGGVNVTYSVPLNALADSYTWTLPAGSTSISGQGTRSISFRYPASFTSGTVSVTATNGCGTGAPRSLSINTLGAGMPGLIDIANTGLCPNRVYTYTIASTPVNATLLRWKVPVGGTIAGAPVGSDSLLTTATSITVSYPATEVNGLVTVQSLNNCSVSAIRSISVKLLACPSGFAPNGSNPLTKGEVTAAPLSEMGVKVFPNPTTSTFNLQVVTAGREEIGVRVLDVQGRVIRTMTVMPYQSVNVGAELKAGSYLVEVRQGQRVKTTRVLKF